MIASFTAAYIQNHRLYGLVGWLFTSSILFVHSNQKTINKPIIDAIFSGCSYIDGYMCVREGCFLYPRIIPSDTQPWSLKLVKNTNIRKILGLVQYINISHTSHYYTEVERITNPKSIECALNLSQNSTSIMGLLLGLIPALIVSFAIIVLLIFLKPSSPTITLNDFNEDIQMYSIGSESGSESDSLGADDIKYHRNELDDSIDSEDEKLEQNSDQEVDATSEV